MPESPKMSANRKTIALKVLEGTDRPDRKSLPVQNNTSTRPDPVFDFTPEERVYYDNLVDHLEEYNLLHKVDSLGLSVLAKNIAILKWCADNIKGVNDVVQTFDNGTSNISGMYTAYTKAESAFRGLMSKWGLSPTDREKIAGMLLDTTEDDYETFKSR